MIARSSCSLLALACVCALGVVACSSSSSGDTTDGGSDGTSDTPTPHAPKDHRPTGTTCTPSKPSTSCPVGPPAGGDCKTDADCTAGTNGHCVQSGGGILLCNCAYDNCVTDADCTGNGVCACQGSPYATASNACTTVGDCKTDADCGAGGYCSPSQGTGCSSALTGYYCHGSSDECIDDTDCTMGAFCAFDTNKKHWACFPRVACG